MSLPITHAFSTRLKSQTNHVFHYSGNLVPYRAIVFVYHPKRYQNRGQSHYTGKAIEVEIDKNVYFAK